MNETVERRSTSVIKPAEDTDKAIFFGWQKEGTSKEHDYCSPIRYLKRVGPKPKIEKEWELKGEDLELTLDQLIEKYPRPK